MIFKYIVLNTITILNTLKLLNIMSEKVLSKRPKKLVRWHSSYVVFVTPEIKEAKWTEKTDVKVSLVEKNKKKKIIIEELEL